MQKVFNDKKQLDEMRIMQKVKDVDLGQGSLPLGDNDLVNK